MPGRLLETLPLQRRRPGQQLIEDHAKGINVRPRVHVEVVRLGLFRTHVQRRAQQHAMGRMQRVFGERLLDRLGQTEVDHFGHRLAILQTDEDVAGLQVSVDHTLGVRVLDSLANRYEECETLGDVRRASSQYLVKGTPLTYSMTKNGRPLSVVPPSSTLAMLGGPSEQGPAARPQTATGRFSNPCRP